MDILIGIYRQCVSVPVKVKQEVSLNIYILRSDKLVILLKNRKWPMQALDRKWCKVGIEWNVPVTENSDKYSLSRQIQVWDQPCRSGVLVNAVNSAIKAIAVHWKPAPSDIICPWWKWPFSISTIFPICWSVISVISYQNRFDCIPSESELPTSCGLDQPLRVNDGDQFFCGRGPSRVDCPEGSHCVMAPDESKAVCCSNLWKIQTMLRASKLCS